MSIIIILLLLFPFPFLHIQDLAGVAHDDIDPSVFTISGDEQKVSSCTHLQNFIINYKRQTILYMLPPL